MALGDAERAILELLAERGDGKTICPSEAARRLDAAGWRGRLLDVRAAISRLHEQGRVVVTQRGRPVDLATARGAIRVGIATTD